jgi:integrase
MDQNKVVLHSDFHMNVASDSESSRPNGSTKRRSTGLLLRKGVWHIDKIVYGKRICESTRTGELIEAEALLAHRSCEARRLHQYGRTFREAGVKFVAESGHLRGLERDERALALLYPFIGELPLQQIHRETLAPFVKARLDKGLSPDTVNRELAMVRRILNLASRVWRDEAGHAWLADAPLIPVRRHLYAREPYPLSVGEQHLLFSELAGHLKTMALFKVNTGLREQEVVNLRWSWEVLVPELNASVFVIPRSFVKNTIDRYVVLNRIARSAIDKCRGIHPEFVFTFRGKPITKFYNSGWKAARRRAAARYEGKIGLPCPKGFRSIRVHDLKHSYGHRLRGAGVSFEDRQLLLGHKMRAPMTTHYSAADVGALIEASERVCRLVAQGSPAMAVVRSSPSSGWAVHTSVCSPSTASQAREPDSPSGSRTKRSSIRCDVRVANSVTRMGDAAQQGGGVYSRLPSSVRDEAQEFAEAHGVSLDEFVAAAVQEKMTALCAPATDKWNTGHWRRPGSVRQD